MKRKIFWYIYLLFTMQIGYAQIQVHSNGNMDLNDHELFIRDNTGNTYGIGYGAYGSNEMVIFSDNLIEFRESDGSVLGAKFTLNSKIFDFYGDLSFNKDHWTGGIESDVVTWANYSMAALKPNSGWYGVLGTASDYFGGGYIHHMYSAVYDDWPSDGSVKENIVEISNALEKIKQLRGVKYDIKESFYDNIDEIGRQALIIESKNRLGFIAQEVKDVFPELVHQEPFTGLYSVNSHNLIPVLVEAIQEQQNLIEYLNLELNSVKTFINYKGFKSDLTSAADFNLLSSNMSVLYQNDPNPFNNDTQIRFLIPEVVKNANIYIFDMQGTQIKSYNIQDRDNSSVTIHGSEFNPGMYLYTLIVDGKEVDTKRMILTEL